MKKFLKFISWIFLGLAGFMLQNIGYGVTTWQFWVISCSFLLGDLFDRIYDNL